MNDKHITEILPDLDKMPDWAREAFEDGQFFNVAFKRVSELEEALERVRRLPTYSITGQRVLYGRSSMDATTGKTSKLFVRHDELLKAINKDGDER